MSRDLSRRSAPFILALLVAAPALPAPTNKLPLQDDTELGQRTLMELRGITSQRRVIRREPRRAAPAKPRRRERSRARRMQRPRP
jgi:hypothetical protein